MLKVAVLVSGGGTNLQAILDAIDEGRITNARVDVVISNNPGAYALERAKGHGIEALCISPKDYESREAFNEAFLAKLDSYQVDLVVLAGFLVVIPEQMIARYRNRIINDPVFLRQGLLRAEGARGSACARRESYGCNGSFCG